MKFSEFRISEEIKQNIEAQGFRRPTDIQFKAIPPILKGEDVLAIAQTGTGKTAAFVIPVLHRMQSDFRPLKPGLVRCLVLEPTHELAGQVAGVFESVGKNTGIRVGAIHGGVDQAPQIEALTRGLDILVSTPGRLFDLHHQEQLDFTSIQILVVDEADHMLDLGFLKDIRDLVRMMPSGRQTLFFSATINEKIKKLAYSLVRDAIRIQISPKDPVSKNVDHMVVFTEMDEKRFFLEKMIRANPESRFLVFVRTKVRAERVSQAMERVSIRSITIHGDKEQARRYEVMDLFRKGEVKILIATDVSARGIDIAGIDFVVNYDLPEQPEQYVHRVGRTGRGTRRGTALSLCSNEEKSLLAEVEELIGKEIPVLALEQDQYKDIVSVQAERQGDWQSLMKEAEQMELERKKKRKKKR